MDSKWILVGDNELSLQLVLSEALRSFGCETVQLTSGEKALSLASETRFDAALLEVNMPGTDGFETCKIMRQHHPLLPILMLSVRDTVEDKVKAFDLGASDFITKPFQLRELVARILAAIRRAEAFDQRRKDLASLLCVGEIELDPASRIAKRAGRQIHLTPKEFKLTYQLMTFAGQPVSHSRLLKSVWGPQHEGDLSYLRTFMHQLRKKLEDDPENPKYLLTENTIGYRFVDTF